MLVLRYVKRIEVEFLQIQAVPGRLGAIHHRATGEKRHHLPFP
jgi:hypothetical protein